MTAGQQKHILPVSTEIDILKAKQLIRQATESIKMGLVDQTKLLTAASELMRNMIVHANGGTIEWELLEDNFKKGIRVVFSDKGPGIPDIDLALQDGYSMVSSMGLGLPGSRRLVNEFEIKSTPGNGTTVTIIKWLS
jgi:serine/threonine-protein kinase RsbT